MPSADALERALLDNVLSTIDQPKESRVAIQPTQQHWFRIWMLALLLIAVGLTIMKWIPDNRIASAAADAILIAGILALGVDPLLKRDLLREAARGIFFHILGFEHDPQVKDKLRDIVYHTKLLRTQLRMVITIEPVPEGFSVTVDYESEITNPTTTPVSYEPYIESVMAHRPEVLRMSLTSTDGKLKWTEKDLALRESEPGVQKANPHRAQIQPSRKGITYTTNGVYRIFTKHGYFVTYTGIPTLQMSIRVEIPDGYEVSVSETAIRNENYWQWDDIQMTGDHTTIRWRKKDGEWI